MVLRIRHSSSQNSPRTHPWFSSSLQGRDSDSSLLLTITVVKSGSSYFGILYKTFILLICPAEVYPGGFSFEKCMRLFWGIYLIWPRTVNKWYSGRGFTLCPGSCCTKTDVSVPPNGLCLILKWNSSLTFIQRLMFIHVECFILLNANPLLYLYGRPFETVWEASSFVLRATRHSWIFHFLMILLPVITWPCSLRTHYYRRCFKHTHTHTHTHQVDYLYICIRMFTSNLPFSAQVLSDTILPAWLSQRISF